MIFKWVKAKCFLSIGKKEVFLPFDKLGNIVAIKGNNLDISSNSSNASGKSNSYEIIVYALFGKLVKGLQHKEVINKKVKKNLEVEVCFELDNHEYRIIRKRKPDSLQLFKDDEDVTLGTSPATQQEIENIVKLNYESFINIVCFGEHNNHAFLSCDAATKRSVVENLLGLEKYLKYCKIAKETLKETENELKIIVKSYENSCNQKDNSSQRLLQLKVKQKTWLESKQKELEQLNNALIVKNQELSKTDNLCFLEYEKAQEEIKTNKEEVTKLESKKLEESALLTPVKTKLEKLIEDKNAHYLSLKTIEHNINSKKSDIKVLQSKAASLDKLEPGVKCSVCFGTVDLCNYQHIIDHNSSFITNFQSELKLLEEEQVKVSNLHQQSITEINKFTKIKDSLEISINKVSNRLKDLFNLIQKASSIPLPQVGSREILLKEQVKELNSRIIQKKEELDKHDPYVEMISQIEIEIVDLDSRIVSNKQEIASKEEIIPYYEFWVDGFGDDGIRAFIIDGILPALNARINYWLQFLIDNKIVLNFDNKFDALIERNPPDDDAFVYNATSGGERRRINLAISQAFAYVMSLSANSCPNVCFLDEISLNIDSEGISGIYNMICELSKDRQIFVITHDQQLNEMLEGADVIKATKVNGFTTYEI